MLYLSNCLYLFFAAGAGKSRSEFSGAFNSSFSRREETINCVAAITFSSSLSNYLYLFFVAGAGKHGHRTAAMNAKDMSNYLFFHSFTL